MDVQSISIRSFQVVKPQDNIKPYVLYTLEVGTKLKSYQVRRRYSDFERLYNDLKAELDPEVGRRWLPSLPPKMTSIMGYLTGSSDLLSQPGKIAERQAGLERWLKTVLVHKELKDKTAHSRALIQFLELQDIIDGKSNLAKDGNSSTTSENPFTSQTWLAEHNEIRASLREVFDMVSRRDDKLQLSDASSSTLTEVNRINLDAKLLLATINTRLTRLASSLEQFTKPVGPKSNKVLTDGEVARRLKLVSSLQDDCERLRKKTVLARAEIGPGMRHAQQALSPGKSSEDRAELLRGFSGIARPTTRVLGAAGGRIHDLPAEENAETRQRDNRQLLDYQIHEMIGNQQEAKLKSLTQILLRQKQIGLMINQELVEQNEILDNLDTEVDSASRKLKDAKKKIDVLS